MVYKMRGHCKGDSENLEPAGVLLRNTEYKLGTMLCGSMLLLDVRHGWGRSHALATDEVDVLGVPFLSVLTASSVTTPSPLSSPWPLVTLAYTLHTLAVAPQWMELSQASMHRLHLSVLSKLKGLSGPCPPTHINPHLHVSSPSPLILGINPLTLTHLLPSPLILRAAVIWAADNVYERKRREREERENARQRWDHLL